MPVCGISDAEQSFRELNKYCRALVKISFFQLSKVRENRQVFSLGFNPFLPLKTGWFCEIGAPGSDIL